MNDLRRDGMMKNQRFEVILWTCLWYDDFQANMVAFDGKISSALNKYYAMISSPTMGGGGMKVVVAKKVEKNTVEQHLRHIK